MSFVWVGFFYIVMGVCMAFIVRPVRGSVVATALLVLGWPFYLVTAALHSGRVK
jgi:hypothetical protein